MTDTTATAPQSYPAVIDPGQLQSWLESANPPRLLDVRTPTEFAASHIPGSYNVPLDLLKEHREEFGRHLDDDVVLVCRSGARAAQAENLLSAVEESLPNVHVLAGGITSWGSQEAPLTQGAETWDMDRQVRLVAGGLVLAAILASLVAPRAKWVAGAIGAGLTTAAITDTCAMAGVLSKLPYNKRNAPTLEHVVNQLNSGKGDGDTN